MWPSAMHKLYKKNNEINTLKLIHSNIDLLGIARGQKVLNICVEIQQKDLT